MLVPLQPLNHSGESGAVFLRPLGSHTRVQIMLRHEPAGAAQPANIQIGRCGSVETIVYRLNNVHDGSSITVLPVSLDRVLGARLVVNVQESRRSLHAAKDARDVSCGALRPK